MGTTNPIGAPVSIDVNTPVRAKSENIFVADTSKLSLQYDKTNAMQNFIATLAANFSDGVTLSAGVTFKTSLMKRFKNFDELTQPQKLRVIAEEFGKLSTEDATKLMAEYNKKHPDKRFVTDLSSNNINKLRFYASAGIEYASHGASRPSQKLLVDPTSGSILGFVGKEKTEYQGRFGVGARVGVELGSARVEGMKGFGFYFDVGLVAALGKGKNPGKWSPEARAGINYNFVVGNNVTISPELQARLNREGAAIMLGLKVLFGA